MAEKELTELDIELLSKYVSEIPAGGVYVEIGTKYGGSAEVAIGANPDIIAHGIDITDEQLAYGNPRFKFHRMSSMEASRGWKEKINVLFIDADHDLAGADWWVWSRYVVSGGVILFHDYAHHSPLVVDDCDRIMKIGEYDLVRRPVKYKDESSMFIIRKK